MAAATTGQPTCSGCGSLLPWEDVDRVAGRCRTCDTAFDFTIPPTLQAPVFTGTSAPPIGALATEVEVPAYTPKPPKLHVQEVAGTSGDYRTAPTSGTLVLHWKQSRAKAFFSLAAGGVFGLSGYFALGLYMHEWLVRQCFGAIGLLFAFFAVRVALRAAETTITATATELRVEHTGKDGRVVPLEALVAYALVDRLVQYGTVGDGDDAKPLYRHVYDVVAARREGVHVRVAETDDKEVAVHVVSLLRQHLARAKNVA